MAATWLDGLIDHLEQAPPRDDDDALIYGGRGDDHVVPPVCGACGAPNGARCASGCEANRGA
jgi:hypothetical protein